MALLSKDNILTALDLKRETVSVPEWKGDVIVSEMGAETLLEFYKAAFPAENGEEDAVSPPFGPTALVFCIVNEAGEQVFTMADVKRLARKSRVVLTRLFEVADRLNLLTNKAREEAQKNSCSGEDGGVSCSSSPANSDSPASGTSAAS